MVRILKIKELEERRRSLAARSGAYRRALRRDWLGVTSAISELKERFSFLSVARRFLGIAAPIAGFLFKHKFESQKRRGFLSRMFSGAKFALDFLPFLKKFSSAPPDSHDGHVPAPDTERTK